MDLLVISEFRPLLSPLTNMMYCATSRCGAPAWMWIHSAERQWTAVVDKGIAGDDSSRIIGNVSNTSTSVVVSYRKTAVYKV